MADGSIDIEVKLNGAPAESEAAKIGQKLGTQVSKGVESATAGAKKSTQQAVNEIGGTLTAFGAKYTKAVTLPIAAAAVATGASAVKIDTALTGVRKTVDGTEQQYKALKDAAIEFSKTNAVDPAQILDIQALGAQLGYSIDELNAFSETVSGLDIATNLSADEAATELAQFANIMGMAHSETKNYGSTIVALGNNFATTEADISHMAMRIAGAGKQIGLTEADVLGLATALSSMGIEAEAGGTAISTIMANIDKEVATNGKNLETWAQTANMSVDEFVNAWGTDAVGALSSVLIGMDAATEAGGNMSVMLDELGITSIRQTDTFKRLASNSEFLGKAVETANDAWRENTALDKEVENRNNSMAAQLQILWNKVQAVAIEVGEPLMKALLGIIDAADPLIDALASGAKAFSDLDEDGQKAVLLAVAVVAGFGPMVGIIGKVTTGITNGSKSWRAFSENLKVVKTNLMTANTAIDAQSKAVKTNTTAIKNQSTATKTAATTTKTLTTATNTATTATKTQTAATKTSTTAMKLGTVAANGLKAALRTIAPVAILTVAIELFTALSSSISNAKENAETYQKATDGITHSMDAYNKAFKDTKKNMDDAAAGASNYALSVQEVKSATDEAIQKTAELADSIAESFSEVGTNSAMVENYAETIQELTNKYDDNGVKVKLSAEEQGKLITAVQGLNDIMGTSYKVLDAENGILDTNTSEILRSADAWKKRALMQAQSAAAEEILKRQVENTTALRKAEELLTTTQEKLAQAQQNGEQDLTHYRLGVEEAQAEVDRLREVDEGLEQEQRDLSLSVAQLNNELNSSVDSLHSYIDGAEQWSKALEASEVDADDFVNKLSEIGVSTEDLAKIMKEQGDEGIQNFINAYKEGGDSLERWMKREMSADLKDSARDASKNTGDGFIEGLSGSEKRIVNAVSGIVGVTNAEFAKLANSAGISGQKAISALALALADGSVTVSSSAEEINAAVEAKLSEMDGEVPASNVVKQIQDTFNAGATTTADSAKSVVDADQAQLNKIDGKTPSSNAMKDWTNRILGAVSSSRQSAQSVKDIANTELNKLDGKTPAQTEMSNWTSAIRDAKSPTRSAAAADADAAKSQLQRDIHTATSWGSHLGHNFAAGIKSATSAAKSAATAVANAAKAVLKHSIPKEGPLREGGRGEALWGEHLVQNFVSGILSSRKLAKSAAMDVAQDIDDVFAGIGRVTKDGIIIDVKFDDPNIKISDSMMRSLAAFNVGTLRGGAMNTYQTNTQNITFAGNVQSPDIMAREFRMQQLYGLAGKWL